LATAIERSQPRQEPGGADKSPRRFCLKEPVPRRVKKILNGSRGDGIDGGVRQGRRAFTFFMSWGQSFQQLPVYLAEAAVAEDSNHIPALHVFRHVIDNRVAPKS